MKRTLGKEFGKSKKVKKVEQYLHSKDRRERGVVRGKIAYFLLCCQEMEDSRNCNVFLPPEISYYESGSCAQCTWGL